MSMDVPDRNTTRPSSFSVVILHYKFPELLLDCVESVLATTYDEFEVIVVDNHSLQRSAEPTRARFGHDPRLRIIRMPTNGFYTGGNNAGLAESEGDIVVFLNDDTTVEPDWLHHLSRVFGDDTVGAASPKLVVYGSEHVIDNVGGCLDRFGFSRGRGHGQVDDGSLDGVHDIAFAAGACFVARREPFKALGGFDPWFVSNYEDVDASWRLRHLGFRAVSAPEAIVYHKMSASISRSAARLLARHTMHFRTNRVAVHAKNAKLSSLAQVCTAHVVYLVVGLTRELLIDRNPRVAFTWVQSSWRLLAHLPALLRQRRAIRGRDPARRAQVDAEMRALQSRPTIVLQALVDALRRRLRIGSR